MSAAIRPRPRSSFLLLAGLVLPGAALCQQSDKARSLAPFVPSPQLVVDRMLEAAEIKPGETVYDLGSGDGRVVITAAQRFQAKAVGVEINEPLVRQARERVKQLGLDNRVQIVHGHLLEVDLSPADVVTVYLLTSSNEQLRPNFEKYLKPGSRVVSHDFQVRGWEPVRVEKATVHNREHTIYVYRMPPKKKQ